MVRLSLPSALVFLGAASSALAFDNEVFLCRHGEKPDDGGQGLSAQGEQRANSCFPQVFGPNSSFKIGKIIAEMPQSNGDRTRPLETVTPLANELGLTVDTSCDRDDPDCVKKLVDAYTADNSDNILICWEHKALKDIMTSLNVNKPPDYPSDSFDIIYTVQDEKLISTTSEMCPGLDS